MRIELLKSIPFVDWTSPETRYNIETTDYTFSIRGRYRGLNIRSEVVTVGTHEFAIQRMLPEQYLADLVWKKTVNPIDKAWQGVSDFVSKRFDEVV